MSQSVEDILAEMRMIEMGIVPITGDSPSDALKTMDHDDARRTRRKFRKLWRKASRRLNHDDLVNSDVMCGRATEIQTRAQQRYRRFLVFRMVREDVKQE
jgi:hypothetical protein|tara:strand:- start:664 stop:963 length:300 start_codon:yes stop_codon:yes gene_type:complete